MYTGNRDFGKQSIHDHVVRLVEQRWQDNSRHFITINPGSEKNQMVGPSNDYPDVIGWGLVGGRKVLRWVAEVETEESVTEDEARGQWKSYAALGVPFYLIVPSGYGQYARALTARAGVIVARVHEYAFQGTGFYLT